MPTMLYAKNSIKRVCIRRFIAVCLHVYILVLYPPLPPKKKLITGYGVMISHIHVGSWQQLGVENGHTRKHQQDKLLNMQKGKLVKVKECVM